MRAAPDPRTELTLDYNRRLAETLSDNHLDAEGHSHVVAAALNRAID